MKVKAPSAKRRSGPSKTQQSSLGAPSQHNQGSRKGKRAWRKNIDLDNVVESLEELRTEERVTGTTLQKKLDHELFAVDLRGDDNVRKFFPKTQLMSAKILSQRSAIPAVFSRTSVDRKHKIGVSLTQEKKSNLLRIGKRVRRGPLNSVLDPVEFVSGSTVLELSAAVKGSGGYDPWGSVTSKEGEGQDGLSLTTKGKVKAPILPHPRDVIDLPAVVEPHQGTSYNPPASAHQELLLKAHEIEEQRERDANKVAHVKEAMEHAWSQGETIQAGVASGMAVDLLQSDAEDERQSSERAVGVVVKTTERKTKQQRRKAARLLAEKRELAGNAQKKRMLAAISSVKHLRKMTQKAHVAREKARAERQRASQQKDKKGLIGRRLGRHKVPKGEIDVQLGEELSESLRGIKPEGNLFRDRFLSLQHRALLEPRVPVLSRKRPSVKVYEKHPWKRFV